MKALLAILGADLPAVRGRTIALGMLVALLLSGCGQKGPLYLPARPSATSDEQMSPKPSSSVPEQNTSSR